jgi:DNA invertase Pin-like site-specific DNA recombinase
LSLEAQERLLKAEADRRGVDLRIVVEQASGGSVSGRPILKQALTDLSNGNAAGLIATKLDRLARSVGDYCRMAEQAGREGWHLIAMDSPVDPTTPMGKAFSSIIATFAELERELIAERTRTAMQQAKANGRRLGGARSERSAELAARVNGMKQAGMKNRAICDTLTSEGVPTLRGGAEWRPSNVQALLRAYENDQLAGVSVV